jgi:N6-adenosine-specific RNA methylase IME4
LLQPIIVRPRGAKNYWLIAGRHRLEAVRQCGRSDIHAVILDGIDADAALLAEIDENLIRCDLSPAERALHVARRKELYEKLHPETRHGATGRGRAKSRQNDDSIRFTKDAASKTGRSERTVQREIERAAKISGLADVIGTPLDAADELDALAKLPESTQRDLIARAKTGEKVIAKHAARRLRREVRERELAAATETASRVLGKKIYGVIYADPPWKFVPYADSWDGRLADDHYPCMPTDAIKTVPVPAADNAVLFLWSTTPMLPQAIETMQAWGFAFKSYLVWIKDRTGTGYWTLNRAELLLIGTRGNVPAPTPGEQPSQVIEAPRGRHSEKPAIFAEIIEKLYPTVSKLEARDARPGWDVWGNEVAS